MSNIIWYLAGPMSDVPQHNIPLFEQAAEDLRSRGYTIISPTELDGGKFRDAAMRDSPDISGGDTCLGFTRGDLLSRDVKLVYDDVTGIIFLPDWHKSRGAKLEAYVALSCGHEFKYYDPVLGAVRHLSPDAVAKVVANALTN